MPTIAILGHSEVDVEISDASIETAKFSKCRKSSKINRVAHRVLAII